MMLGSLGLGAGSSREARHSLLMSEAKSGSRVYSPLNYSRRIGGWQRLLQDG